MERYFLNEIEVPAPRGIDGLTRQKSRSRRYFSILYKNVGYAQGVGNVTFADALSRNILLTAYRELKVSANTRFRAEFEGVTEFEGYIDYLTWSRNRDGIACAFRDETGVTRFENQAVTSFSIATESSILLRPKRITGPATHTINPASATVQRSSTNAQSLAHAVPLVRPEKADSTLPGQLLTVETPMSNSPMYRNTTNEAQGFRLSGRVIVHFSANAIVSAYLTAFVYSPNGEVAEVRQGELLVTSVAKDYTLLVRANLLVQPGGWVVLGFKGSDNVQRYTFVYGSDTTITLESSNQAPESKCRGLLAGDLLSALINRATDGKLSFHSTYFSQGDGRSLFITNGANLRGLDGPIMATLQSVFEGLSAPEPLALWLDDSSVRCERLLTYLNYYATRTVLEADPISLNYKTNPAYLASEVLTGFETWRGSGPLAGDEFNGSHQYVSTYKTVRQTLDLRSKTLIASGNLIEEQRRKQFIDQTSTKTSADADDDKLFVICVATDRNGQLVGETRERTPQLANCVDTETPYNVRLTPRRSLKRWAQILPFTSLTLESAKGNSEVLSRYEGEDYAISESESLTGEGSLLGTELIEVSVPMSQHEFNELGDWITVYDEGSPVTGLLMDASWRTTGEQGPVGQLTLFL